MKYTFTRFNKKFPSDNACLQYMFAQRYGRMKVCRKCGAAKPRYYRVRSKKVFECSDCGYQISPLANTIFHKSGTSLRSWFYVIFMFSVSKNGVSAKEVERTLGVTYKTAWRMAKLVRSLMQYGGDMLSGVVEADETFIGGYKRGGKSVQNKVAVFGAVERNGNVYTAKVRTTGARVLLPELTKVVAPGTTIHTDKAGAYRTLNQRGYNHTVVNHSALEFARGSTHTNTIEGFWSQLKRSMDGTYHAVSPKYLQSYLNEFAYRYNLRGEAVFPCLIERAAQRVA